MDNAESGWGRSAVWRATETRESFQGVTDALMEILPKGPFAEEGAEEFSVHKGLRLVGDDDELGDD